MPSSRRTRQSARLVQATTGIVLAVLGGCAQYHTQPLQPEALAHRFESRRLDDPDLHHYIEQHAGSDSRGWNLSTLTLAAFYYSPRLDLARARWEISKAALITARERPNPVLQLSFGDTVNPTPETSPYLYGLGLDIPIETAGKRGYRISRAERLGDAALLQIGQTAWNVRRRLRSALVDLYSADREALVLGRQGRLEERLLALMERRLDLGAASTPDVNLTRTRVARVRIDEAHAMGRSSAARADIASVIGIPVDALHGLPIHLEQFDRPGESGRLGEADSGVQARREALLGRSDLRAALALYASSQAALQLEVARQYPDVHLGPGYAFDAGLKKFSLSLGGMSLPVFNRNEGPIAEAGSRRKEAAARFTALQAKAINEMEKAAEACRAARALVTLDDALQTSAERSFRSAEQAFGAGETDRVALLSNQSALEASTLARTRAWVGVQRAIGQLEDALQRPVTPSDADVLRSLRESPR